MVSSSRSNTAMTAETLLNGEQSQFPVMPVMSAPSGTQLHQFMALACRHSPSGGVIVAMSPIGRQASLPTMPAAQSGVSAVTVVGAPPATIVNSLSTGAPGGTSWLGSQAAQASTPTRAQSASRAGGGNDRFIAAPLSVGTTSASENTTRWPASYQRCFYL